MAGRIYTDQRIDIHISMACDRVLQMATYKGKTAATLEQIKLTCLPMEYTQLNVRADGTDWANTATSSVSINLGFNTLPPSPHTQTHHTHTNTPDYCFWPANNVMNLVCYT